MSDVPIRFCCVIFLVIVLCACGQSGAVETGQQTGGNIQNGQRLVASYGCGSCHVIPGVAEANGRVGPTLEGFGSRYYIAGLLVNTPPNLVRWVSKPQEVLPGNAMPNVGVTEQQARDIAAYLYTLR